MSQQRGQTRPKCCAQRNVPNRDICCVEMLRSFGRGFIVTRETYDENCLNPRLTSEKLLRQRHIDMTLY